MAGTGKKHSGYEHNSTRTQTNHDLIPRKFVSWLIFAQTTEFIRKIQHYAGVVVNMFSNTTAVISKNYTTSNTKDMLYEYASSKIIVFYKQFVV